ncbi:MAG: hypothetical protein H0U42_11715 [Thermoleophilaceae bacterium]|nr:hypothetical protein [Thermoleophilaceae bacterium]
MTEEAMQLPDGVFSSALAGSLRLHEERIRQMYNRNRALFAEFIVAGLLPGAEIAANPGSPWDVTWKPSGQRRALRLQVKCSGAYLPRMGPEYAAKASWEVTSKGGWDPDLGEKLERGHHCDLYVLVRHEGLDIEHGWSFWVVPAAALVESKGKVTPKKLEAIGAGRTVPNELADVVSRAGRSLTRRRQ